MPPCTWDLAQAGLQSFVWDPEGQGLSSLAAEFATREATSINGLRPIASDQHLSGNRHDQQKKTANVASAGG